MSNTSRIEIDTLNSEFDSLLAQMQAPAARAGMEAAFNASPKEMGKAAVALARKDPKRKTYHGRRLIEPYR
jgi:antitoxin Phd